MKKLTTSLQRKLIWRANLFPNDQLESARDVPKVLRSKNNLESR